MLSLCLKMNRWRKLAKYKLKLILPQINWCSGQRIGTVLSPLFAGSLRTRCCSNTCCRVCGLCHRPRACIFPSAVLHMCLRAVTQQGLTWFLTVGVLGMTVPAISEASIHYSPSCSAPMEHTSSLVPDFRVLRKHTEILYNLHLVDHHAAAVTLHYLLCLLKSNHACMK